MRHVDGTHVIHYTWTTVVQNRSVVCWSASQSDAPTYRLTYDLAAPDTLTVRFDVEPPGATAFRPIATASLTRAR